MSVLIKGMKMPQYCAHCELFHDEGFCTATGTHVNMWGQKRNADCPLIELPDHGDLIDRDALMKHKGSAYDIDGHELYAVGTGTILRMPVVIPAERSEE